MMDETAVGERSERHKKLDLIAYRKTFKFIVSQEFSFPSIYPPR